VPISSASCGNFLWKLWCRKHKQQPTPWEQFFLVGAKGCCWNCDMLDSNYFLLAPKLHVLPTKLNQPHFPDFFGAFWIRCRYFIMHLLWADCILLLLLSWGDIWCCFGYNWWCFGNFFGSILDALFAFCFAKFLPFRVINYSLLLCSSLLAIISLWVWFSLDSCVVRQCTLS